MDEENLKSEEDSKLLKWWQQRSELEKKLLIVLVVAALLIIGMLMFSTIKPKPPPEPCSSSNCLITTAEILNTIDTTVDPCHDFFQFACNKRLEKSYEDSEQWPRKQLQNGIMNQVIAMMKEPINEDDHAVLQRQKELFQGCMDENRGEESLKIFKQLLEDLNGWPVVVGSTWKGDSFYWTDIVTELRKKGYEYSMVLDIGITRDPLNFETPLVHVSEPYISIIKDKYKELYKKYMTDVALFFGAKQERAEEDMEKVLDFREKLRALGDKNIINLSNKNQSTRFTVQKFQSYNYEIDWLKFLNDIVDTYKISKTDYVVFPTSIYIDEFSDLMGRTPERIQANYIIWSVLEGIMPLLSKELRELQENFNYQTKIKSSWENRLEYCLDLTGRRFFPLPSIINYARKYLPNEQRESVQDLATNIKSAFVDQLQEMAWIKENTKQGLIEKLERLNETVGTRGDYFDDSILEESHANKHIKNIKDKPFFQMYLDATKYQEDMMFSIINLENMRLAELYTHTILLYIDPLHISVEDLLILPVGFLQGSFSPTKPSYTNYAAAGSRIGQELSDGLFWDRMIFDSELNTILDKDTEASLFKKGQCLIKELQQYNSTFDLEEPAVVQLVSKILGVSTAYAAYQNWVSEHGEEEDLIGIDYTPNQLFWINAMSYRCSMFTEQDMTHLLDNNNLKILQETGFVRHNENFAHDFSCSTDTPMNPSERCQII